MTNSVPSAGSRRSNEDDVPDAELMIATGCAHCAAALAGLTELVKKGRIGRLEVINIARHPEIAEARGVRGVPWMRIGPFELRGAHNRSELADWAARAGDVAGIRDYLSRHLQDGELDTVIAACRRSPQLLPPLLTLAGDLDTPLAVRIGVGAVLEDLATDGLLTDLVDAIAQLAGSPHAQLRADGAHILGLTHSERARTQLEQLTRDEDPEVREIAAESLKDLAPIRK